MPSVKRWFMIKRNPTLRGEGVSDALADNGAEGETRAETDATPSFWKRLFGIRKRKKRRRRRRGTGRPLERTMQRCETGSLRCRIKTILKWWFPKMKNPLQSRQSKCRFPLLQMRKAEKKGGSKYWTTMTREKTFRRSVSRHRTCSKHTIRATERSTCKSRTRTRIKSSIRFATTA